MAELKAFLKKVLPSYLIEVIRALKNAKDLIACASFLLNRGLNASLKNRIKIVRQMYLISYKVESPHTQKEVLSYIRTILSLSPENKGVVVEAGCYKGGSTAKFSLATDIVGKELVVFDSFQGIPESIELHGRDIFNKPAGFRKGDYRGTLNEVKANVADYGKIARCRFVAGWFKDTLPGFKEPVSAIYLDVDLASSTRTCLKYLYPLLEPGGVLYSQDGHLPLVIEVFNDDRFWQDEVGCKKPLIFGIGREKLIKIIKKE